MNNDSLSANPEEIDNGPVTLDTRGKRPAFFESADVDALMTALLESMSQLWAARTQIRNLEQLLIKKGVIDSEELAQFTLPSTEKEKDQEAMQAFFADAFRAMLGGSQTIDNRQTEIDKFQNHKTTGSHK
jgi:hypothetical protein